MTSKGVSDQGGSVLMKSSHYSKLGRKREESQRVYLHFMNLEKAHDRVNREAIWQVANF